MRSIVDAAQRSSVLRVRDLSVLRGSSTTIEAAALDLPEPGIAALVGRSREGRTALLEAIAGLLPATGSVKLDGESIDHLGGVDRARRGIVLAPRRGEVFSRLTVAEHVVLAGDAGPRGGASPLLTPSLARLVDARAEQRAETLSGGERRLLALAMVALRSPRVVLLDEPSEGVARALLPEVVEALKCLAQSAAILIADSDAELLEATATSGVLLEGGAVRGAMPFAELRRTWAYREVLG